MKKILFAIIIVVIIILSLFVISKTNNQQKHNSQKIKIVTTIFPLFDFVRSIGQDKVEVSLLLPPGVEAHAFEPRPSDLVKINEADIFIYTGKFMEPWVDDIIKGVSNKKLKIIDSSLGINMIASTINEGDKIPGLVDPHIWLDFDNDKIIADAILAALSEKDFVNADFYRNKELEYKNKLVKLDNRYQATLSDCKKKEIVYGGHYAFGYLAHRYGLKYLAAQGVSPDSEPTAKDLILLVAQIKENNIKYVFYEELASPKIAEILAGETGTEMLLLNAAHNITKNDFDNNLSFLDIMEGNLINLKIGLECNK
ncbi:MAG: zinc ABC transporter substrate-binding protein [Patescibacteria group bacterium]